MKYANLPVFCKVSGWKDEIVWEDFALEGLHKERPQRAELCRNVWWGLRAPAYATFCSREAVYVLAFSTKLPLWHRDEGWSGTAAARRSVGRTGQKTSQLKQTNNVSDNQTKSCFCADRHCRWVKHRQLNMQRVNNVRLRQWLCEEEGREEKFEGRIWRGQLVHLPTAMLVWTYFPQLHVTAGS